MKKIWGPCLFFLFILFFLNTSAIRSVAASEEVHLPVDEILAGNSSKDIVGDHDGQVKVNAIIVPIIIEGIVFTACSNHPCDGAIVSLQIPPLVGRTTTADSTGHFIFQYNIIVVSPPLPITGTVTAMWSYTDIVSGQNITLTGTLFFYIDPIIWPGQTITRTTNIVVDSDQDGDGYTISCEGDCNDTDPAINPGATEVCDDIDNDCDGVTDEEGNAKVTVQGTVTIQDYNYACPGATVLIDCPYFSSAIEADDAGHFIFPETEIPADGNQDFCCTIAAVRNQTLFGTITLLYEGISDFCISHPMPCSSYGVEVNIPVVPVGAIVGFCDGLDNDDDGLVDEEDEEGCNTYYKDADNDTYGVTNDTKCLCSPQSPHTAIRGGDCNDTNAHVNPFFTEKCNDIDDNCNGTIDEGFDVDGDTYKTCTGDCDDTDPDIHPGAAEDCDALDNDCNGSTDEGFNLQTDPQNCGTCGQVCSYPHAAALCASGKCQMGSCDDGWQDQDGNPANGCEYHGPCVDLPLNQGWNLISMPVLPDDPTAATLFPDAVVIYEFDPSTGYIALKSDSTMEVGRGYWINISAAKTYQICGQNVISHSEDLPQGWSLIGGISYPSLVQAQSGNIVVIYYFDPSYGYISLDPTQNLVPGTGYWINLSQAATIEMECPTSTPSGQASSSGYQSFSGQTTSSGQASSSGQTSPLGNPTPSGQTSSSGQPTPSGQTSSLGNPTSSGQTSPSGYPTPSRQTPSSGQPTPSGHSALTSMPLNTFIPLNTLSLPPGSLPTGSFPPGISATPPDTHGTADDAHGTAWETIILVTGQEVESAIRSSNVIIGMGDTSNQLPPSPVPPEYTVRARLKDPDMNNMNKYYGADIRALGSHAERWVIRVEINNGFADMTAPGYYPVIEWNMPIPDDPTSGESGLGKFELHRGDSGDGDLLVADMKSTHSYQTTAQDVVKTGEDFTVQYFSIVWSAVWPACMVCL